MRASAEALAVEPRARGGKAARKKAPVTALDKRAKRKGAKSRNRNEARSLAGALSGDSDL